MLNKFLTGLVAGLGFSIALVVVITIWITFVLPTSFQSDSSHISQSTTSIKVENKYPLIENFDELSLDQKISNSTAIIVTKIAKDEAGRYKSVVSEVLKKQDDVELYYKVGDEYDDSDYNQYEAHGDSIPKGFIVFMRANPARMQFSTSYSGDRVGSLGGISMELLREKCSE